MFARQNFRILGMFDCEQNKSFERAGIMSVWTPKLTRLTGGPTSSLEPVRANTEGEFVGRHGVTWTKNETQNIQNFPIFCDLRTIWQCGVHPLG